MIKILRMFLLSFILVHCGAISNLNLFQKKQKTKDYSTETRNLRSYSLALRGMQPLHQEILDFKNGKKIQDFQNDWMNTSEVQNNITRYFKDLMGVAILPGRLSSASLNKTADGIYYHPTKGSCQSSESVSIEPWWTDPGTVVSMCKTSVSDAVFYTKSSGEKAYCLDMAGEDFKSSPCGCGPHAFLCLPSELQTDIEDSINKETGERGKYIYNNGLSWKDYFSGDFLITDKYLLYAYARTQIELLIGTISLDQIFALLKSTPLKTFNKTALPLNSHRHGIVTSIAFMSFFNNMRSRARALTRSMLCKDIDPTLNTDGTKTFLNPSLTDADRAHGQKTSCSYCHYGLDNVASAFLRYDFNGIYTSYLNPLPSDVAHIFGQDGEGPEFVASSYIERGQEFHECMSQTAWKSFSGESWYTLTSDEQETLKKASLSGPKDLLNTVLSESFAGHSRRY